MGYNHSEIKMRTTNATFYHVYDKVDEIFVKEHMAVLRELRFLSFLSHMVEEKLREINVEIG